jgi:hypothetical protein
VTGGCCHPWHSTPETQDYFSKNALLARNINVAISVNTEDLQTIARRNGRVLVAQLLSSYS